MRFYTKPQEWCAWFAWYPVKIDNATVWLEFVERFHTSERIYFRDRGSTDNLAHAKSKGNYKMVGD
jgi:hypothetical protein